MDNHCKSPLLSLSINELKGIAVSLGLPSFIGKQISEWLYKHRVTSIDEMTNLSKKARQILSLKYEVGRKPPIKCQESIDGTKKYLFSVTNGGLVESVYIPDGDRATLCISSQVGCKMNCLFCQTGKQGFSGNLCSADIVNQLLSVDDGNKLTNVVFMGMGEPLDNLDNVMKAIEVFTSSWGLAWSPKRITLSTVGVRKGLKRFLNETKCHLAVSVHNPYPLERAGIMPIEKGFSIVNVMDMLRLYDFSGQRRMSVEYILFDGVNDTEAHAKQLAKIMRGIYCRINLIPFHQIPNVPLKPLSLDRMENFRSLMEKYGYVCTIRTSRGQDIDAACGMLSTKEQIISNT